MEHICKWCGRKEREVRYLVGYSCNKSPGGKCQPFEGGV